MFRGQFAVLSVRVLDIGRRLSSKTLRCASPVPAPFGRGQFLVAKAAKWPSRFSLLRRFGDSTPRQRISYTCLTALLVFCDLSRYGMSHLSQRCEQTAMGLRSRWVEFIGNSSREFFRLWRNVVHQCSNKRVLFGCLPSTHPEVTCWAWDSGLRTLTKRDQNVSNEIRIMRLFF